MMITANGSVTIYHYNEDEGTYNSTQYPTASIYHGAKTVSQDGNLTKQGFCKIRIPTMERIDISTDDYIYLGLTDAELDKSKCLKVMAFGDNRFGSRRMWHWRIECYE